MSIDWPYKQEDLNQIIKDLEEELNQKSTEIQMKTKRVDLLNHDLQTLQNKIIKIKAKLGFMNDEIIRFESELEKSILKKEFFSKEIENLKRKVKEKEDQITQLNVEMNQFKKELKNQEVKDSRLENLVEEIKRIFSYKGFLSEKEFEDLIKDSYLNDD